MARHNELGKFGELKAIEYLLANNYEVLEANYRFKKAEIDIIARKEEILIFVEVKTRSNIDYGLPESFVTGKKINLSMKAAYHYMDKINHEWEIRFDVIALIIQKNKIPHLKHIEDAFVP